MTVPAVRRATSADAAAIDAIAVACGLHVDAAAELARPHALLLVATTDPDVVGGSATDAHAAGGFALGWHVADELSVLDVGVAPSQRRRGLGATLVDALVNEARARDVRQLLLEVRRSNVAALWLYRAAGFTPFHVRRAYYREPPEDAVELRLLLGADGARLPEPEPLPWSAFLEAPAPTSAAGSDG